MSVSAWSSADVDGHDATPASLDVRIKGSFSTSAEQREAGEDASVVVLPVGESQLLQVACACRSTARELR